MSSPDSSSKNPNSSETTTGTCLCTSITVTLHQPLSTLLSKPTGHICHCTNCRAQTGTTGFNGLATTKSNVTISDPLNLLKTYLDSTTSSGRSVERHFCSNCSSPIWYTLPKWEEGCSVPLGIFPRVPRPEYEFFARNKESWMPAVEGVKSFDEAPTVALAGREGEKFEGKR